MPLRSWPVACSGFSCRVGGTASGPRPGGRHERWKPMCISALRFLPSRSRPGPRSPHHTCEMSRFLKIASMISAWGGPSAHDAIPACAVHEPCAPTVLLPGTVAHVARGSRRLVHPRPAQCQVGDLGLTALRSLSSHVGLRYILGSSTYSQVITV